MNLKKVISLVLVASVLGQTSLTLASEDLPEPSDTQTSEASALIEEPSTDQETQVEDFILDIFTFVSTDDEGNVTIPKTGILDFLFPEEINGEAVYRIGPGAFQGCPYFHIVAIPASITEIGEGAFANCPNLEKIILLGRADNQNLILGENWFGDAQVIYELEKAEEELLSQPVEETNELNEELPKEETLSDEGQSESPTNEEEILPEILDEITTEITAQEEPVIEEIEEPTPPTEEALAEIPVEESPEEETPVPPEETVSETLEEVISETDVAVVEESEVPVEETIPLE